MELELPDKKANLELHGQKYMQDGDHVVKVPDHVGHQFLSADIPGVRKHTRLWGGIDFKELEKNARRRREAQR